MTSGSSWTINFKMYTVSQVKILKYLKVFVTHMTCVHSCKLSYINKISIYLYYRVTSGVPQGSILEPDLWNALYDGLLRTEWRTE